MGRVAVATGTGAPADVISLVALDVATPGPGQVLVEVAAAAVNHSELLALKGGPYADGLTFPVSLGYEGAGIVVAVGSGATATVGDRVAWAPSPGACADRAIVPYVLLVPVPDALDLVDAARVLTAGVTARLLADLTPVAGRAALVWGAGGAVGRALTHVLAAEGADVTGVVGSAGRHVAAGRVLDRSSVDIAEALGRTMDIVYDPVGATTYATDLAVLRHGGHLIGYGELSGALPVVRLDDLMVNGVFVTKFGGGGPDFTLGDLRRIGAEALAAAVDEPARIAVGADFRLDDVVAAYEHLGGTPRGKVVVTP